MGESVDERVRALEDWRHRVELQATQKLAEVDAHRSKIDEAIGLIAETQASMSKEIRRIDELLKQIRTAVISVFLTAVFIVLAFSQGTIEALKAFILR